MTDNRTATLQRLVIRIGTGSLSFSTTRQNQVEFENYPLNSGISLAANMREALRTSALPALDYQRVLVMVDTPVLMVPTDLFRQEQADTLYRHAFSMRDQQVVRHAVQPDLNSVAVFATGRDLSTVLGEQYPEVRYTPVATPVWRHLHQRSYTGPHNKLYCYQHDRRLEVFSFADNRFKFYNAFVSNNPNDTLYYLLAVWKQLALQPEHDELYLVGQLTDGEALTEKARQFVKRVFLINPSGEFNRSAVTQIEGMPYDLMILYIKGR